MLNSYNLFKGNPADREDYFRDISTFGGCTAGPAAALENLRILEDEKLLENASHMGEYLMAGLRQLQQQHPVVGDVRGKGLFLGIELVNDPVSKEPVDEQVAIKVAGLCLQKGLMIGRTNRSFSQFNNTLCLSPALTINQEEADRILSILDEVITEISP